MPALGAGTISHPSLKRALERRRIGSHAEGAVAATARDTLQAVANLSQVRNIALVTQLGKRFNNRDTAMSTVIALLKKWNELVVKQAHLYEDLCDALIGAERMI
jgi:hypothetical protein